MPRDRRMGTSDMVSTPPATTTSLWPAEIWQAPERQRHSAKIKKVLHCYSPVVTAILEDMHAIVTV